MKSQPSEAGKNSSSQNPEAEVLRLLEDGKCKQAVELAKDHHKRVATPGTQRLLVQAYAARIAQFQSKGMSEEAQTLLTMVQQRYPQDRQQLEGMEILSAMTSGRIDDLLRPLTSDQTPPQTRVLIETALARQFTNLPALAASGALPEGHPLRVAAAAAWRAFLAVTTGPVTDVEIALPEISHRSPFAAWKMLVRAVAAFYRRDDAGALRAVDAIPIDSAVAPLVKSLRGLLDAKKPTVGIAAVLHDRVWVNDQPLRAALEKVDASLRFYDLGRLLAAIRDALRLCAATRPEMLEKLRQHISILCFAQEVPLESVINAIGTTRKNAYFWRLIAQASESMECPPTIPAILWHRFLIHGVAEKMFAKTSREAAAIWLHIANLLSHLSLSSLEYDHQRAGNLNFVRSYYDDQPVEIARLRPDEALIEFVLEPGQGFREAAKIQPDAETFTKWWEWAGQVDLPEKLREGIALDWHQARPRDVLPLVNLSSLAEKRNALSLAIKRLGEAEAIDPLNHQVRQARVRLTMSITWRHFAERKAHLVEKDLTDLEALPSMGEGDRAALLESMRGAWHALRKDENAEAVSRDIVLKRMGPLAGTVIFDSVKIMAKQAELGAAPAAALNEGTPLDIALAQSRILTLVNDLNLKTWRPANWTETTMQVLKQNPCPLSNADISILGMGAVTLSQMELAYQASVAGLGRTSPPATTARFLLLRAMSLNKLWHRFRKTQCLRSAMELAKQSHDEDLIREIFSAVDRDDFTRRIIANARDGGAMNTEVLNAALQNETQAEEYPSNELNARSHVVDGIFNDPGLSNRFSGFASEPDDDDYDDDEELFDPPEGLTPEQFASAQEILKSSGFDTPNELLKNPELILETMARAMGTKLTTEQRNEILGEMSEIFGAAPESQDSETHGYERHRRKNKKRKR